MEDPGSEERDPNKLERGGGEKEKSTSPEELAFIVFGAGAKELEERKKCKRREETNLEKVLNSRGQ